jgi:hypothetical protein
MFHKSKWFKVFWLAPIVFSLLLAACAPGAGALQSQAASVNDATEIKDNPQIGDTVEVEGRQQADGSVLADKIKKK